MLYSHTGSPTEMTMDTNHLQDERNLSKPVSQAWTSFQELDVKDRCHEKFRHSVASTHLLRTVGNTYFSPYVHYSCSVGHSLGNFVKST